MMALRTMLGWSLECWNATRQPSPHAIDKLDTSG